MKDLCLTTEKKALNIETLNQKWEEISECVAQAFRMEEDEKVKFKTKDIAKLIGMLPFIAACDDAERTAVAHLGLYVLSVRETKHYFNANINENSDIFERLRLGRTFKGGNQDIIEKGMSILALNMLTDYEKDIHIDDAIGKYNPVADGSFNSGELREKLEKTIQSIVSPEIDKIICSDVGTRAYWGYG